MTWPEYEVAPGSPWNYGLVLNSSAPASSLTVVPPSGALPANPFTHPAPLSMTVTAQQIANWHSPGLACALVPAARWTGSP